MCGAFTVNLDMGGIIADAVLCTVTFHHSKPGLPGELEQPARAAVGSLGVRVAAAFLLRLVKKIGKINPRLGRGNLNGVGYLLPHAGSIHLLGELVRHDLLNSDGNHGLLLF